MLSRPLAVLALAFAPFAPSLVACSGADRPLVDDPPSSAESSSSGAGVEPAGSSSGATSSGGSSSGNTGSTGSSGSNGSTSSGGSSGGSSSSGGGSSGAPLSQCPAGGTTQSSGGDSPGDATPFVSAACGSVTADGADYWTFSLEKKSTSFGLNFSGHVQVEVTVNGATIEVDPGTPLPFDLKHPYVLRVTSADGQVEPYVVVVDQS
jgi:hypothetical protein